MSRKDYITPSVSPFEEQIGTSCGPVVLYCKVNGKIEKFTKKSEKQEQKNILSRLGNPQGDTCCVNFRDDPSNYICVIVSYRKVKVETGKFTEKSPNQQA